jgi:hypothetical protein
MSFQNETFSLGFETTYWFLEKAEHLSHTERRRSPRLVQEMVQKPRNRKDREAFAAQLESMGRRTCFEPWAGLVR